MPERLDESSDPSRVTPWAFALNRSATTSDAAITLLGFTLVGGLVRVSGLVCFRRPDLRLARMPDLAISAPNRPWLVPIGAHLLPQGDLAWVGWIFERPMDVAGTYHAQIDHLDLAYRTAGRAEFVGRGPWVFRFRVRRHPGSSERPGRDGAGIGSGGPLVSLDGPPGATRPNVATHSDVPGR